MAVDFLEEIYHEANAIFVLKKLIRFCHSQQYGALDDAWKEETEALASFCKRTVSWNEQLGMHIWNELSEIRYCIASKESIRAADRIEKLIPSLYEAMQLRGAIDVEEGDYRLFSSKTGFLSIVNQSANIELVGTIDPAWEAFEKASVLYEPGKKVFCSFGCELGYLAWQMFEVSDEYVDIYIYETEEKFVEYARNYGVLDWIPDEKVNIVINKDATSLFHEMINTHFGSDTESLTAFYIEGDRFNLLSGSERDLALEILQNVGTSLNFNQLVERNFYRNHSSVNQYIDEMVCSKDTNEWIVVGGGPSVDYNLDYIKQESNRCNIIAATTVVKRLLSEGIRPDYLIAIDMQTRTFNHLIGMEDSDIPIIISDCANWKFSELYRGEKYLIPTGDMFFSRELYKNAGITPWNIPGTVVGAAIEVAIKKGAGKISLVGLDFSFPTGKTHANGMMDQEDIIEENCIKVPSVCGGFVNTDLTMKSYIGDVENIVMNNKNVSFCNRSKNGALIRGCI